MKNFSLRTKILGLSSFLLMIAVAIGLVSFWSSQKTQFFYDDVVVYDVPAIRSLSQMLLNFRSARIELLNSLSPETTDEMDAELHKHIEQQWTEFEAEEQKYLNHHLSPTEESLLKEFLAEVKTVKEEFARVQSLHKKKPAVGSPDSAEMNKLAVVTISEHAAKVTEATNRLLDYQAHTIETDSAEAHHFAKFGSTLIVAVLGAGFLLGGVFSFLFAGALSKQLQRISSAISNAAEQTSSGGSQLAASSSQLSTGSTEAAASLEETVASLEELSSMVTMNTGHSQEANLLSQKSKDAAEKGEGEIGKLIGAMSDIASGSKKIEDIINVIDDIAFQTNLLALNAAVEAARAGEQGKGFSVVAEAVRTLAQRSSAAAKDISSLIKENVGKSEHGARIAGNSGSVFKDILGAVKKVADLNGEIATGSAEQAHGLEQISKAMNQLDQATQGNAAASEEAAAAAEEMAQQAHALANLVIELQGLVAGSKTEAEVPVQDQPKKSMSKKALPRTTPASSVAAPSVIPFDDDQEPQRKIGKVSGF